MNNPVFFDRITILGVGLIGGSLARAARTARICREIVGWGRNAKTPNRALTLGVIDRAETDLHTAVYDADLVVVATPPGAMEQIFRDLNQFVVHETIFTDVGSTKGSIVSAAREVFTTLLPQFVPGHPIAGTEHSGVEASDANLFKDRRVILTPLPETNPIALKKVRTLWEICGAQVTEMEVGHHDAVLAATSHLPHLLAFALVNALAQKDDSWEIFRYAAGGFRDFTRIASSDPVMWRDICLANSGEILAILQYYQDELVRISRALERQDGELLHHVFGHARAAREHFLATNYASLGHKPKTREQSGTLS